MSKYLRPDNLSKRMRYRASLAKANSSRYKWSMVHSNIKDRHIRRLYTSNGKVLPSNVQFKIRFFGMLHHATSHGNEISNLRWKCANIRWEKSRFGSKRNISGRTRDRLRPYL